MKRIPVTVEGLASLGNPREDVGLKYYQKRGIGPGDVPELIRIATNPAQLLEEDDEASLAGDHAVRALAALKAVEAVGPLLEFLGQVGKEEVDWLEEDLGEALSRFGPAVLPDLTAYLSDKSNGSGPRSAIADAIGFIGLDFPEHRDACVAILTRQLEETSRKERDSELNSMLIDSLVALEAVEAFPLIERVYATGRVDEEFVGDLHDVRVELGLDPDEDDFEDDFDDDFDDDRGGFFGPPPWEEARPRTWADTPPPVWEPLANPDQKTPKQRAEERAKARKKQKKKKK